MCEIEDQTKFYNSKAEKTGWRDFISTDFIKNLLPYGPSILELKGLKVKWLNRINVRRLSWDFISTDFINPPSCQAAQLPNFRNRKAIAFTMAEILISLTIIGIIAAITLPSLKANINEKTWATQKKALYSRLSQAIAMMPALNGYGEYAGSWSANSVSVTKDTATQAFVTDGLAKVLKINNICDKDHLKDCGLPDKITTAFTNTKMNFPTKLSELNPNFVVSPGQGQGYSNTQSNIDTSVAGMELNDVSVAVFYNPYCRDFMASADIKTLAPTLLAQPKMCANFVYDLNGRKGPNKMGKDIGFITALYPTDSMVVAPKVLYVYTDGSNNFSNISRKCRQKYKNSRATSIEELMAVYYNRYLLGISRTYQYSSKTVYSDTQYWMLTLSNGNMGVPEKSATGGAICVER